MPSQKPSIFTSVPYTATVTVRQNAHVRKDANDRGYYDNSTQVEAGVLLDITLSANDLSTLEGKIAQHVGLIE